MLPPALRSIALHTVFILFACHSPVPPPYPFPCVGTLPGLFQGPVGDSPDQQPCSGTWQVGGHFNMEGALQRFLVWGVDAYFSCKRELTSVSSARVTVHQLT